MKEITEEFIYDLQDLRRAFIIDFNLFKRSFQTCTQGFIESLFVLPYTFPKAFLTLRYKYRMSILRFFYLFFHEIIVNIRNTVNDIKGHIISKLKGQKAMKAQEFGELLMKNIEENINWTPKWHLISGDSNSNFVSFSEESFENKEKGVE